MQSGPSSNFIEFFREYKIQNSLNTMNICVHGRNSSNDFLSTVDILDEVNLDVNYNKILKVGGLHSLIKIYDPAQFNISGMYLNRYNFGNYFSIAQQKKLLNKKGNKIEVNKDFFISLDEGSSNEIIFGSRSRTGHLIDVDFASSLGKSSVFKKFEVEKNRMIVNVDLITSSQQQRRSINSHFGFLVINNPGNYISSLGLSGVSIQLMRRNEIDNYVPEI